jgi:tetratricopeptide (TPR) repeat protein
MFPHDKLDWHLSRLEKRISDSPDDAAARLDYARHCLSRAQFHGGGEVWFNRALTQARRVLQSDPASPGALVVAGASLVGLDRLDRAAHYLDEALRLAPERADVHLGLGTLHHHEGDRHLAVRELEAACRQEPDAWEANWMLGKVLHERAEELGSPRRLIERSQFHTVRALSLGPSADLMDDMLFQLGLSCVRTGRMEEAQKIFNRLAESPQYKSKARWFLGLVNYNLGRYKNAVLFLRQHLIDSPENPHVLARIGMAYLHLGEVVKAREACNKALAVEPGLIQARWTLGCAILEEGRIEEAVRVFRELLSEAPDHVPAFMELVRIRRDHRDVTWLRKALRAEVTLHDRMPVHGERLDPVTQRDVAIEPRSATRERIAVVRRALCEVDDEAVKTLLDARVLTTDEGLRFELWGGALDQVGQQRARLAQRALTNPKTSFSAQMGREVLMLADVIPEQMIIQGLDVSDKDVARAAVDRHGPAGDVGGHRGAVDEERAEARAWQALLLLALASRGTRSARNLLTRWEASRADAEIKAAVLVGLCLMGDVDAATELRPRATRLRAGHLLDALVDQITPPEVRFHPRPVSSDEHAHCTTCGRRETEVGHMMAGGTAIVCDGCITEIARNRRAIEVDDPSVSCGLCGNTILESRAVYGYQGLNACADCVDNSLGLLEREEVDRYLAAVV